MSPAPKLSCPWLLAILAIFLSSAAGLRLEAQTACDPSTSPPNVDNFFSLPSTVLTGEPFLEQVHVCGVPTGTSIRVKVAFVSATTGQTAFTNQAPTDINGVAPVFAPVGLSSGDYNLTFSSPDVPNLTTGPRSGFLIVQKGDALSALDGLYIFLFRGVSTSAGPAGVPEQTHILGSFIADGKGSITSGEADMNSPAGLQEKIPLAGKYTLDFTGRGTLSLVSALGTLSFALSMGGSQSFPVGYESGAFTSAPGSALIGTGSLKLADPGFQAGPPYSNTIIRLQGETACDAACRDYGGHAGPITVSGNLCLGCLPNTAADGPELYRAVINIFAGKINQMGLVQSGYLGPTDRLKRSIMSATSGSAGMPQRYAVYNVDVQNEYLLSLDPHDSAAVVSGKVIAADEHYH